MTTATRPRLDVGAMAATALRGAHHRLASALASFAGQLSDTANPLDEKQHAALVAHLLGAFDGFERELAGFLVDDLQRAGVEVWGLSEDLKDLAEVRGGA